MIAGPPTRAIALARAFSLPRPIALVPRFPASASRAAPAHSASALPGRLRAAPVPASTPASRSRASASAAESSGMALKVAVVGGSGNVGSALARDLCLGGADVVLASRKPEDQKTLEAVAKVKEGASGTASAAGFKDAIAGADAIIIATPGYPTEEGWKPVVEPLAGYAGVVLDATNPLTPYPGLEISCDQNTTSATEILQKLLPDAKVYKAFNSMGVEILANPVLGGKEVSLLFAGPGDDAAAKDLATKVISTAGFNPIYVGPTRAARNLESIAELWIHMAVHYQTGSRTGFAFDIQKA